jgi:hypothetical protein
MHSARQPAIAAEETLHWQAGCFVASQLPTGGDGMGLMTGDAPTQLAHLGKMSRSTRDLAPSRWAPIVKPHRPWRIDPNLADYEREQQRSRGRLRADRSAGWLGAVGSTSLTRPSIATRPARWRTRRRSGG